MSQVQLKNRHLLIEAEIASSAFGDTVQVLVAYYPQRRALLLAPSADEMFQKAHPAAPQMLKNRNPQGDKSLSLEEILIDHDLDETDRELAFLHQPGLQMLHVTL